jgi:hypothetical protein
MLHGSLEGIGAAELRVDDDESNSPVDHDGEANEENGACNETCVADGVGLANDAGASAKH